MTIVCFCLPRNGTCHWLRFRALTRKPVIYEEAPFFCLRDDREVINPYVPLPHNAGHLECCLRLETWERGKKKKKEEKSTRGIL